MINVDPAAQRPHRHVYVKLGDNDVCTKCGRVWDPAATAEDNAGVELRTITLPDDIASLVYDELQGALEHRNYEGDIDERDPADVEVRVYRAIEFVLNALDDAGARPSPLGTYGPIQIPDYVREGLTQPRPDTHTEKQP